MLFVTTRSHSVRASTHCTAWAAASASGCGVGVVDASASTGGGGGGGGDAGGGSATVGAGVVVRRPYLAYANIIDLPRLSALERNTASPLS